MINNKKSVQGYWICLPVFVIVASGGIAIAFLNFVFSVFWNFVYPPILGPLLQGTAILTVILGAQMIVQKSSDCSRAYSIIGLIIAVIAFAVAAKEVKISLIGTRGYTLIGLCVIALLPAGTVFISRIPRNSIRIISGVMIMLFGIIVPVWLAGLFAKDLL